MAYIIIDITVIHQLQHRHHHHEQLLDSRRKFGQRHRLIEKSFFDHCQFSNGFYVQPHVQALPKRRKVVLSNEGVKI
jgi:hypothetical protein